VSRNKLFIDPGLDGAGAAHFLGKKFVHANSFYSKEGRFEDAALHIAKQLRDVYGKRQDIVVVEFPCFFPGRVGYASAARGDILRLAYSIGVIQGVLRPKKFVCVPVREYKGQLPKSVAKRRVKQVLRSKVCRIQGRASHAWDAAYIGVWWHRPEGKAWRAENLVSRRSRS